jgi:fatty-acyl-CoA synthase
MPKFDALDALRLIERYRVTHGQWVPTMFVRLLQLPEAERKRFDLSSMRLAVHAAAPCPVEIKRRMIEWWGPIIEEYYAASEGHGMTRLGTAEWLAHPGSVGRAKLGILHICDDDGNEVPVGETGLIYFELPERPFTYHKDPEKTQAASHPDHPTWLTVGDIGRLDGEGYLYLTDRKAFMIISGGVNIYPQQIEDALILHPKVRDVAVIGVPNEEMGEEVKAVVEAAPGIVTGPAFAAELMRFLDGRIARYMLPKSIDFVAELPRLPTGKLYKHALRERYRQEPMPTAPSGARGTPRS